MKKLLSIILITCMLTNVGCATLSNWWQQFQADPVAQTQVLEQYVAMALNDATIAFQVVKNYLPADVQVKAQAVFDAAILAVNHAMQALTDAVQAAVLAQTPNPDFTALVTDVTNAVLQVIAVVDQFTSAPSAPPSAIAPFGPRPVVPPGLAEAKSVTASMQAHFGAKKAAQAGAK